MQITEPASQLQLRNLRLQSSTLLFDHTLLLLKARELLVYPTTNRLKLSSPNRSLQLYKNKLHFLMNFDFELLLKSKKKYNYDQLTLLLIFRKKILQFFLVMTLICYALVIVLYLMNKACNAKLRPCLVTAITIVISKQHST